ncbi:hypothetical protein AB0E73_16865, partial [Streptomyces sp. NPDC031705]
VPACHRELLVPGRQMGRSGHLPAARPWPEPVNALIAAQKAQVEALLAQAPGPEPVAAAAAGAAGRTVRPRRRWSRRTRLLVGAGVLTACAAAGLTVGRPFVEDVYYTVVPETVPTPGTTPLSQVADKYVPQPFSCSDVAGKVTVPADFDAPQGYGFTKSENYGWGGPSHLCVWHSRYGDEIYVSWGLYVTEPGVGTGAQQAKKEHEGLYIRGRIRRDFGLGFAEEGMWLPPDDDKDPGCVLYLRDVNQTVYVQVKGNRYPAGSCETVARDAGRSALAVMARP